MIPPDNIAQQTVLQCLRCYFLLNNHSRISQDPKASIMPVSEAIEVKMNLLAADDFVESLFVVQWPNYGTLFAVHGILAGAVESVAFWKHGNAIFSDIMGKGSWWNLVQFSSTMTIWFFRTLGHTFEQCQYVSFWTTTTSSCRVFSINNCTNNFDLIAYYFHSWWIWNATCTESCVKFTNRVRYFTILLFTIRRRRCIV